MTRTELADTTQAMTGQRRVSPLKLSEMNAAMTQAVYATGGLRFQAVAVLNNGKKASRTWYLTGERV